MRLKKDMNFVNQNLHNYASKTPFKNMLASGSTTTYLGLTFIAAIL